MSKKIIVTLGFFALVLFSCGTSPREREDAPSLAWQYEGIARGKIPGKLVRIWEKPSLEDAQIKFVTLEILKGADAGQFHIGFIMDKKELGLLGFYEYDQRQVIDASIDGKSYGNLSLRRISWDAQRDFIGFLSQGNSIAPSEKIYAGLKGERTRFPLGLKFKPVGGDTVKEFHFDLGSFQKERQLWLEKEEKNEKL